MASGNDDLLRRLKDPEDQFTERKLEGVGAREFRKTIVAFANSVPEGQVALLFVGVGHRGAIEGVNNPDSLQETIRLICHGHPAPSAGTAEPGPATARSARYECTIEGCTQHFVTWLRIHDSRFESVPLEDITISRDEVRHRPQLDVTR
jgi:hypothetical protein